MDSLYLRTLRRKGIGSLPSATNTACSARSRGLPTGAELFGIAQYIPASAIAVSTISTILFIGEFSETQISRPAKYKPRVIYMRVGAVDNYKFSKPRKTSRQDLHGQPEKWMFDARWRVRCRLLFVGFWSWRSVLPDRSLAAVACHASGYPGGCCDPCWN
jgi:hypothetical protein